MNEMFRGKLLNSGQVSEGCELVNDVGGDTVLDGRTLDEVFAVVTSGNRHRLTQNRLKKDNDSAFSFELNFKEFNSNAGSYVEII